MKATRVRKEASGYSAEASTHPGLKQRSTSPASGSRHQKHCIHFPSSWLEDFYLIFCCPLTRWLPGILLSPCVAKARLPSCLQARHFDRGDILFIHIDVTMSMWLHQNVKRYCYWLALSLCPDPLPSWNCALFPSLTLSSIPRSLPPGQGSIPMKSAYCGCRKLSNVAKRPLPEVVGRVGNEVTLVEWRV